MEEQLRNTKGDIGIETGTFLHCILFILLYSTATHRFMKIRIL